MANLPETATYDAGVYQLETTDPVIGGADGKDNASARNLANRTAYLKARVDLMETIVSQADAEAGISTTLKGWNALRVRQAIQASGVHYKNYLAYSDDQTLSDTNIGGVVGFSGGLSKTFTLPALSGLAIGSTICIVNVGTGLLTIDCHAGDFLQCNSTSISSIPVLPGDDLIVTMSTEKWVCTGGLARIKYSSAFAFGSGYQKLPDGKILQTGTITTSSSADVTFTFPIAFPNNALAVIAAPSGASSVFASVNTITTTSCKVSAWVSNTAARSALGCYIFAIGY